jgi:hypothetical protein
MAEIKVIHNPSEEELKKMGVREWPIWTKEESKCLLHLIKRLIDGICHHSWIYLQ